MLGGGEVQMAGRHGMGLPPPLVPPLALQVPVPGPLELKLQVPLPAFCTGED